MTSHVMFFVVPEPAFKTFSIQFMLCGENTSSGVGIGDRASVTCPVCQVRAAFVIANRITGWRVASSGAFLRMLEARMNAEVDHAV